MAKALKVTLVKSLIGLSPKQEATVKALGLRHVRQTVEHDDTPTIRGMIRVVPFCVTVQEGEASAPGKRAATASAAAEPGAEGGGGERAARKKGAGRAAQAGTRSAK